MGGTCPDCLSRGASVDVILYNCNCRSGRIYHVPNGTRNTMAHELGHIPGLEHHTSQTHLMYGNNYVEDPFRTRGCIVPELLPDGFIGERNTTDRYWELSSPLNETNDAPDELRGDMGMVICKKIWIK